MPRQGEGHIAHNAVDANVNPVAHGAGEATVSVETPVCFKTANQSIGGLNMY